MLSSVKENFWTTLRRPILALAPMEGVTNSVFRTMARSYGADVVYTEFVSADAIHHRAASVLRKLSFDPTERPVVCQIFGTNTETFVDAGREIEARGFSSIDINCGCPSRKVVHSGAGASLMRDPGHARRLVEALCSAVSIPVSIKVRSSAHRFVHQGNSAETGIVTALDFIRALEGLPVAAVMVHGRSLERGFSGDIDFAMIRSVKEEFSGIVIGNGGVFLPEDAGRLLSETGADGVGIARGSLGSPWIFSQIRDFLSSGTFRAVPLSERLIVMQEHARRYQEAYGTRAMVEFRKHLGWYCRGFDNAASVRRELFQTSTVSDITSVLERFDLAVSRSRDRT